MLTIIEDLLDPAEIKRLRNALASATWIDGAVTAGSRAASVKQNRQLAELDPLAVELGNQILRKLGAHPLFLSAALPEKIYPPKFNLYQGGEHYGTHVDAAIMRIADAGVTMRTDLSATLFLSDPDDYEGGELLIEGPFGAQPVKLAAGDLVLYPASSLHQVSPVTQGQRIASFFWVQSAVADDSARAILFDLDQTIQALSAGGRDDAPDIDRLTHIYHNLLRRWAKV